MIWLIGLGGSLGAASRYLLSNFIHRNSKSIQPFPLGTWIINISGSFLLGVLANLHAANEIDEWLWYFAGVGFCGAYTTFSTFGYEVINLIQAKEFNLAIAYVLLSLAVGVFSALVGFILL